MGAKRWRFEAAAGVLQALEGNPVDVDAVIEVLMGADLSPAAAAASEAAAHSHTFSPQSRQPPTLPAPPGEAPIWTVDGHLLPNFQHTTLCLWC